MGNIVYLPKNLDLDEILKKKKTEIKNFKKDNLVYILGLVVKIRSCNKEYLYEEYIPLKAAYIQSIIRNYKEYIEYAKDNGILECDDIYIEGEKCYGYKFSTLYDEVDLKGVNLTDLKVINSIKKNNPLSRPKKYQPLYKWYEGIEIDYEGALNCIIELKDKISKEAKTIEKTSYVKGFDGKITPKTVSTKLNVDCFYRAALGNINYIKDKEFNLSVDKRCGRLHSNITNMKKELRDFLTYKGVELVAVDLKNCQPFLSTALFKPEFYEKNKKLRKYKGVHYKDYSTVSNMYKQGTMLSNRIKVDPIYLTLVKNSGTSVIADISTYFDYVLNGTFYEEFAKMIKDETGKIVSDRAELKKVMFQVFFTSNSYKGKRLGAEYKNIFNKHFPNVYKLFEVIKKGKDKDDKSCKPLLAVLLQNIESRLILDKCCGRITKERPDLFIITIHDSIVTTKGNEEYIKKVIEEEALNYIGNKPKVEFEYWKNPQKSIVVKTNPKQLSPDLASKKNYAVKETS
jgi:hypothetical protein